MKEKVYLEHPNITVNNLKEAVKFFQTAFPHFKIRGSGNDLREWVHLGDDITYIAINQAIEGDLNVEKNYDKAGINHIGFVVPNVEEVAGKLLSAVYKRDYPKAVEQYRIRDYFADADGNQYEFVQYLSEVPEERNNYDNVTSNETNVYMLTIVGLILGVYLAFGMTKKPQDIRAEIIHKESISELDSLVWSDESEVEDPLKAEKWIHQTQLP